MRPNFFVNTPDILHAYLQYGGPAAFKIRAVLAATGSPSWGVYAGYELYEHVAVQPGQRGVPRLGEVPDPDPRLGRRRAPRGARWRRTSPGSTRSAAQHPALQRLRNLTVHPSDDENVLVFSKPPELDGRRRADDIVIVVVNLDPHGAARRRSTSTCRRSAWTWDDSLRRARRAHRRTTGSWGQHNYVRLDPGVRARAHADGAGGRVTRRLEQARPPTGESDRRAGPVPGTTAEQPTPDWFKTAVFYEVLVRSFRDSNGDGIGDFRGPHREARLPAVARRRLPVGAAVLHLAAARRRLRRRRLHRHPPRVRHGRGLPRTSSTRRTSAASA